MPPSYRQFEAITVQATPVYTCTAVPTFYWEVYRYSGGGLSQKYIIHVHLFYHHVCLVHVIIIVMLMCQLVAQCIYRKRTHSAVTCVTAGYQRHDADTAGTARGLPSSGAVRTQISGEFMMRPCAAVTYDWNYAAGV